MLVSWLNTTVGPRDADKELGEAQGQETMSLRMSESTISSRVRRSAWWDFCSSIANALLKMTCQ